jgi:tetratricopeptide (TPR) repeat protein
MANPTFTLSQAFIRAVSAYKAGKLVEAERICQQIINTKCDLFDVFHLLAIVQSSLGKRHAAVASYDRALKLRPDYVEALSNRGTTLQELNRFEEALASYDRALKLRPDYAEALSKRGTTLRAMKRFEEALASYDRALKLRPDYAEALSNRGNTLRAMKRLEEALASYDRALKLRPDYADVLSNRGTTLHELKRFEEALASYDRALQLRPDYAEALSNRGNTLRELKRFEEALASCDRALKLRADYAEALSNRGATLHELKRFEEALASYDQALKLRPDYAEALSNRGNTLQQLKRFDEALASYDRALKLWPDYVEALSNRGTTLHELNRFEEALASYDRALQLRPDYAEALSNRGNTLHELKRFDEALTSCDRSLQLRPDYAEALSNRGNTLRAMKRFEEALASYDRALELRPDYAEVQLNEALCYLLIGDFDRGWEKYEWRWGTEQLRTDKRNFAQPLWTGRDDIRGKTILLHAEQGFGDTIQFCRYAKRVAWLGATVLLEIPTELKTLLRSLEGPADVIARGEALPRCDFHIPLASLPLAFKTTLQTIPAEPTYLRAPPDRTAFWRERLEGRKKPRIGIVWAGNPQLGMREANRVDSQRSLRFDQLAPLLAADCEFYSLQKGHAAVAQLRQSALRHRVIDATDELHDFADTAGLVANLDLVISVDTSVAHLVGALGKQFWLLNRFDTCWRWLLDRDDSPWYPSARLFRQDDTREWEPVIARVVAAVREFVQRA